MSSRSDREHAALKREMSRASQCVRLKAERERLARLAAIGVVVVRPGVQNSSDEGATA